MRKKLDTRFPAARIKKIMQADEDVGKIAMAVPVLVSKALELFLQDLCDRTYDITLRRGAKTVNSLHLVLHLSAIVILAHLIDKRTLVFIVVSCVALLVKTLQSFRFFSL